MTSIIVRLLYICLNYVEYILCVVVNTEYRCCTYLVFRSLNPVLWLQYNDSWVTSA